MYSSTLPSTSALDGGGWSTPRPGRFTPEVVGWAPGPVWTGAETPPPGFDPRTVQPVASRYTDCAIAGPSLKGYRCSRGRLVRGIGTTTQQIRLWCLKVQAGRSSDLMIMAKTKQELYCSLWPWVRDTVDLLQQNYVRTLLSFAGILT
jgi:hypothetical protein